MYNCKSFRLTVVSVTKDWLWNAMVNVAELNESVGAPLSLQWIMRGVRVVVHDGNQLVPYWLKHLQPVSSNLQMRIWIDKNIIGTVVEFTECLVCVFHFSRSLWIPVEVDGRSQQRILQDVRFLQWNLGQVWTPQLLPWETKLVCVAHKLFVFTRNCMCNRVATGGDCC